MKKLLLLGGAQYLLPVIEEAHKLGLYVITCDYLPDNIAHKHSDEYRNVSIIDKDAVLSTARELGIDGIMSFACDPGVVTAAYVAEKLDLPFAGSYEAVSILQNKGRFRRFLTENGFNVPWAKSYTEPADALSDSAGFNWPMIVKPVDSAGSKGVTRVDSPGALPTAIEHAKAFSICGDFILEEFITQQGFSSDTDCFSVDGVLRYCSFDEQHFDAHADNPYTPAAYAWPSTMPAWAQAELRQELQRLITLLGLGTGLYNIETRLGTNGKTYIREVAPRGGGNRIAELQDMATGQSLISNEIRKALGMPMDDISIPKYDGVWCNYILHSYEEGTLVSVEIDPAFKEKYVRDVGLIVKPGDHITPFRGANNSLGTLFLRFDTREELDRALENKNNWLTIKVN